MRTRLVTAAAVALAALIATAAALAHSLSSIWVATRANLPGGLAALAFVLAVAACGGGEEGGSAAEEGGSKEAFIRQADAICAEATEKRDAYYQQHPEIGYQHGNEPGFEGAIAKYATTMEPVLADAITELKRLKAPRGDEETIEAMLGKFEEAFARIERVTAGERAGSRYRMEKSWDAWAQTAVEGQNIAFKYGSKECARFGNP